MGKIKKKKERVERKKVQEEKRKEKIKDKTNG